jgi:hypothetical protein
MRRERERQEGRTPVEPTWEQQEEQEQAPPDDESTSAEERHALEDEYGPLEEHDGKLWTLGARRQRWLDIQRGQPYKSRICIACRKERMTFGPPESSLICAICTRTGIDFNDVLHGRTLPPARVTVGGMELP